MKTCTKCGETKPFSEFSPSTDGRDGLRSQCKACRASYSRNYAAVYPEKIVASNARYYTANAEDQRARQARRRAEHPEQIRANNQAWPVEHPEEKNALNAGYRARKFDAPGRGITSDEWLEILAEADGICTYCEKPGKLTMDHIVPLLLGGAHDIDNIAAACGPCNSSKGARPLDVFLQRSSE
jgi:5-methylcytosine-specific restriction endonuclease McrA